MKKHWAEQYIGLPYRDDAFGPDAFNCWTFVWFVEKVHFRRAIPYMEHLDLTNMAGIMRTFRSLVPEAHGWAPTDNPVDGDVVLMGHGRRPHHAGIWADVDQGGIIHCAEGQGVVFSRPADPATRLAWRLVEYYGFTG